MTDLATFCQTFGVDQAAAERALAGERDPARRTMPWYVQLILGLGAWITALAIVAFGLAFMALVLDMEEPKLPHAGLGVAMCGLGLWLLARRHDRVFRHHFAAALCAAGSALAAIGIGFESDDLWSAAAVAALLALLVVWRGRDPVLQFLTTALAVVLVLAGLIGDEVPYRVDIVAFMAPLGLWLYLRPPRTDVRPAATVLLLAMPLLAAVDDIALFVPSQGGWIARAVHIGLFLALLWPFWPRVQEASERLALRVSAVLAVAVCLLMPAGGSAALLLMMLAFTLGSRAFAIIGTLLQVYFIWRFYYDLEASLLDKSLVLMGVGVLLLAAYAALTRRQTATSA
jgi:hypothetical protein